MDNFQIFYNSLLDMPPLQVMLFITAAVIIYAGPVLIKKKYLRRNKILVDENIEDRNSWILFPKQYNSSEKLLMIAVYVGSFLIGIIAVNVGG